MLGPARGDGIAKDLARALLRAVSSFDSSTPFDLPKDRQHFGRRRNFQRFVGYRGGGRSAAEEEMVREQARYFWRKALFIKLF